MGGIEMEEENWISTADHTEIYVKKWFNPEIEPKAIVQLSHGMVEHIQRYHDFAMFLLENDIFVYGNDHRGHGKTGEKQGQLGYFATQHGFTKTANDLHVITKIIKAEYPKTPLFLFGHSMGSFLARHYIQNHSNDIDGLILSGTGFFPAVTHLSAKALASMLPAQKESNIMNTLAFGSYNRKITNKKTNFDWLTRDHDAVTKYIEDLHAGYTPTARFFYDLMDGLGQIHNKKLNENIDKDLPILLISGDADPVGHYSKGVWKVAQSYTQLKLHDIKVCLFDGARHELLHEINKKEVYSFIYHWIINKL